MLVETVGVFVIYKIHICTLILSINMFRVCCNFLENPAISTVKSAHSMKLPPNIIAEPPNSSKKPPNPSDQPTHFPNKPTQRSEVPTRSISQPPRFTVIPTNSLDLPTNYLCIPTNFMDEKAKKHHNVGCFLATSPANKAPGGLFC